MLVGLLIKSSAVHSRVLCIPERVKGAGQRWDAPGIIPRFGLVGICRVRFEIQCPCALAECCRVALVPGILGVMFHLRREVGSTLDDS